MASRSVDGDGEGLGLGVARGVGDGEGVGCGFEGSYIHAARIRGPNGIGLRLELDGFGVGHAVTELDGLAAANLTGSGVKGLDGKLLAAHLFEGGAVILALLFRGCLPGAIFEGAILPPSGNKNPGDYERTDHEDAAGVESRVLKKGFAQWIRFGWLLQQGVCSQKLGYSRSGVESEK